ncbi:putative chromatin remodeling & transcription regulator BTB-POZ family [Helianthus debilis subsp. tardiflorus]
MRESNFDVFDPRTVFMDFPEDEDGFDHGDFGFAYNNSNFSDRVLHIYISFDPIDSTQSPPVLFKWNERVKAMPCNLANQCLGFLSLTSCFGTEEAGLMELLKFMYNNNLTVTSAPVVLDVLMVADKYNVASCIRHCRLLLRNLMITTPEIVLLYLGLPSNVLMAEALHPLIVAAKQLYAVHYKDITKFEDEILRLPLAGVEAIIASDDLQVTSEYDVYLFVLKWARSQYPNIENSRKIIMNRPVKFIRYPYMIYDELREFLYTKEF